MRGGEKKSENQVSLDSRFNFVMCTILVAVVVRTEELKNDGAILPLFVYTITSIIDRLIIINRRFLYSVQSIGRNTYVLIYYILLLPVRRECSYRVLLL